jgi:DNA helicase-2/ATP-dependent DNA helicase PcrA
MNYLQSLNKEQSAAVQHIQGPLLLLAGAGTGKTRVITYRMKHMLHSNIDPEKIVAVTFTNKAAREMKERLNELCGDRSKQVFVGTFHSFCIKILRKYCKEADLGARFQLIGSSDQVDLVSQALEEMNLQGVYRAADWHGRISHCKNNLISPEQVENHEIPQVDQSELETFQKIYVLYEKLLRLNQVIDFDDCILKCANLLRDNDVVRQELHRDFKYFLVDEFQDTNFAQLSLLRSLVNSQNNICVVGDDDQSIYSWRGAMYETIERFEQLFAGAELIKLEQNYRCTKLILDAANNVIKNNALRKKKTLWSEKHSTAPIVLKGCKDETNEAQWIALKILALFGQGNKPSDIGILYRANALARPLEIALREHRLHYKVYGGQSFFERKEIKDFMAYLRLIANSDDRLAFWRIVNTPNRSIGLKSCELINEVATRKNCSPFAALKGCVETLPKKSIPHAKAFIDFVAQSQSLSIETSHDFAELCRFVVQATKLDKYYREKATTTSQGLKKAEMIRELPNWLMKSADNLLAEKGKLDFRELMDALTLQQEDKKEDDNSDHISLMTIHSAKGLEFPYVFLAGVEDDLLPHRNSVEEANGISEERRLFYVALTRAKEQLYLSHTLVRSGISRKFETKKLSRFVKEIPEELIASDANFEQEVAVMQKSKRDKTKSRLSMLTDELRGFK